MDTILSSVPDDTNGLDNPDGLSRFDDLVGPSWTMTQTGRVRSGRAEPG